MTTFSQRFVFGVEADYAFHKQIGTVPFIVGCSTAACSGGANGPGPFFGDSTTLKTRDDYSFRLRAGYLVMPELQIYATGGLASQRVWAQQVCSTTGAVICVTPLGPGSVFSTSTEQLYGYTVGGGVEWKVWNNILVRGEYRYNDYGTWKQAAFIQSGQVEEFANVHVKSQLLTFGLAYLFTPPR